MFLPAVTEKQVRPKAGFGVDEQIEEQAPEEKDSFEEIDGVNCSKSRSSTGRPRAAPSNPNKRQRKQQEKAQNSHKALESKPVDPPADRPPVPRLPWLDWRAVSGLMQTRLVMGKPPPAIPKVSAFQSGSIVTGKLPRRGVVQAPTGDVYSLASVDYGACSTVLEAKTRAKQAEVREEAQRQYERFLRWLFQEQQPQAKKELAALNGIKLMPRRDAHPSTLALRGPSLSIRIPGTAVEAESRRK